LEGNHGELGVASRVCIYVGSWRTLEQVQEGKYQPWLHGAHQLGHGHHMAQMEIFIEISDTVRICMYKFKRRIYNFKILVIIIRMQQIKKNSSSIFMKGPEAIYNK
jgi:hypothetical protein